MEQNEWKKKESIKKDIVQILESYQCIYMEEVLNSTQAKSEFVRIQKIKKTCRIPRLFDDF